MAQKTKKRPAKKGLAHHAKRLYHGTPKFAHGMVVGAVIGWVVVIVMSSVAPTAALSLQSPRDCDTNAVINCGVLTPAELQRGYNDKINKNVSVIYKYFGISASDIKDVDKLAQSGRVYKNGNVMIGNNLVATNAISAGREIAPHSTKVTFGGATFYNSAPKDSFAINSIAAYVYMKNGEFSMAILAGCGNPVNATAVKKAVAATPQVVPAVAQDAPEDTLPPNVTSTQLAPSQPTPVVVAATTELPHTGPGSLVIIGLLSVLGGYLFHATHRHIRHKRQRHFGSS